MSAVSGAKFGKNNNKNKQTKNYAEFFKEKKASKRKKATFNRGFSSSGDLETL